MEITFTDHPIKEITEVTIPITNTLSNLGPKVLIASYINTTVLPNQFGKFEEEGLARLVFPSLTGPTTSLQITRKSDRTISKTTYIDGDEVVTNDTPSGANDILQTQMATILHAGCLYQTVATPLYVLDLSKRKLTIYNPCNEYNLAGQKPVAITLDKIPIFNKKNKKKIAYGFEEYDDLESLAQRLKPTSRIMFQSDHTYHETAKLMHRLLTAYARQNK